MLYRHHENKWVFGPPDNGVKNYEHKLNVHKRYKFFYDAIMWMFKDTDYEKILSVWGR